MLQEKNRKYYSSIKYHKKIYLVYYKKNNVGGSDKLVSDGYASVLCVGDISENTKVDQNYFLEHER